MLKIVQITENPKRKRTKKKMRIKKRKTKARVTIVRKNPLGDRIAWKGNRGKSPVGDYFVKKNAILKGYKVYFNNTKHIKGLKKRIEIGRALSPVKAKALATDHVKYVRELAGTYKQAKVTRALANPARKKHQTMIIGMVKMRDKKYKRAFYTGRGFSFKREDAKIFPGDGARMEAKKISNCLPPRVHTLYMEKV